MPLRRIAEENDCSVAEARTLITRQMKREAAMISSEERGLYLDMEIERLDELQYAHWTAAMSGDPFSSRMVLEVIKERAKLRHLYEVDPAIQQNTVLVVSGAEQDYIKALKSATEAL